MNKSKDFVNNAIMNDVMGKKIAEKYSVPNMVLEDADEHNII